MTPERHREIGDLYCAALQVAAVRRAAFLRLACAGDETLRQEVESLLAFQDQAEDFLKSSPWDSAAIPTMPKGPLGSDQSRPQVQSRETDQPAQPSSQRRSRLWIILPCALGAILMLLGALAWRSMRSQADGIAQSSSPVPHIAAERTLRYSLMVRKNPKRFPDGRPFYSTGNTELSDGDQVRFHVSSPQPGFLYIINEGASLANGLPEYNVLFPDTSHEGHLEISADRPLQIPAPGLEPDVDWFVVDTEGGVERIWLVWAAQSVPALERVGVWVNPKDKGQIGDHEQIRAVSEFLQSQPVTSAQADPVEIGRWMVLKGRTGVLVGLLTLEHRR